MHSRKSVRQAITKFIYHRNRTHYLKWEINREWSIRFFFTFDTRKQYNGKWVLKSHFTKDYIVLTRVEAIDYIQYKCDNAYPQEYFSLTEFGKGYRRILVDPRVGAGCFLEKVYNDSK